MDELALVLLCCIPAAIGAVTILYVLFEQTVLEPLRHSVLVLAVDSADAPVAEMLRVARFNSWGHATLVLDAQHVLTEPGKLVAEGLCDDVVDAAGLTAAVNRALGR